MAWIIAGLIGLMFGGPRGLIVALVLLALVRWGVRKTLVEGLGRVQEQLVESAFAVMGAVSKADGVVSRDEIRHAEAMFVRLHLNPAQREAAKAAFNRGKRPDFDLDAEVARFARVCRGRRPLMQMFLQLQLSAVAADGRLHPAEHEMLVRVARGLGLSEMDVQRLEALLRASSRGPGPGSSGPGGGAARGARLADAYKALGVDAEATDAELKRAYRRLMSQNHPDKLGREVPESLRELAEERSREINAAYDLIKEARGLS
ncbi:co-chaperone DjlA [Alkalilimnicola sp. S0819]|nr:co-chaperone DjlA [Alkalilimnicola sp. S0819]MPQ15395.1 co-chaperone DjlA [Alkalilimnicola sp. S0819]